MRINQCNDMSSAIQRGDLRAMAMGLLFACLAAGCSEKKAPPASPAPPHQQRAQEPASQAMQHPGGNAAAPLETVGDESLTAKIAAAGIPAQYVAHFEQGKLIRIDETRQADQRRGSYEYYGARLVKYSGAAVNSPASLQLTFNLQGAMTTAQADSGTAADTDIRAIRDRAQLLRSHALAQRSTRAHSAAAH